MYWWWKLSINNFVHNYFIIFLQTFCFKRKHLNNLVGKQFIICLIRVIIPNIKTLKSVTGNIKRKIFVKREKGSLPQNMRTTTDLFRQITRFFLKYGGTRWITAVSQFRVSNIFWITALFKFGSICRIIRSEVVISTCE